MVDVLVERINGPIALLLAGTLVLDGQNETLYSIRHGLGVRRQQLPSGRVIRIDGQALGGGEETVAGAIDVLSGSDDGFLCLAGLSADLGWGGGKLGAGGKGSQGLDSLHQWLGGLGTCLAVGITQVTSKSLTGQR